MVEVDQIGDHLDKIFSAVRQKLLGMPSKIAPLVQAEESISGVRIVLESAIFEVLSELSEYNPAKQKTDKVNSARRLQIMGNYFFSTFLPPFLIKKRVTENPVTLCI